MDRSTKFLTLSALGAANTLNARKPFARQGGGSVPAFGAGWLTSELPLHTIAWQAAATGYFGSRGAFRSPLGKAALAVSAASWAGLAGIYREATKADQVLERALEAGLGSGYRDKLANDAPPVPIARARIANPFGNPRKTYGRGRNISYGEAGKRNNLDVWHRADLPADGSAPVLLQVHGGAWVIGNKDQQGGPLMEHMSEQGWVCVAINYRLSPKATWPDHVIDVKRAIAWIRENIADYGGDPDYIAITGGSAGGHLSSLAALSPNEPTFQPGFEEIDTTVRAAVPLYGVYDFRNRDSTGREDMKDMLERMVLKVTELDQPDLWDQASTMHWVNEAAPPFFAIHGRNDSLVPVEQARSFTARMRQVSKQPVVFAELPGTQHAFDVFGSVRTIHTVRAIGRFLESMRIDPNPADSATKVTARV